MSTPKYLKLVTISIKDVKMELEDELFKCINEDLFQLILYPENWLIVCTKLYRQNMMNRHSCITNV